MAGTQAGYGDNLHSMPVGTFPAVAVMGNCYSYTPGTSAELFNSGGGATLFGSAYNVYGTSCHVRAIGYGCFTAGYAFSYTGNGLITNDARGSFVGGYCAGMGSGTSTIRAHASAGGAFVWGRTPPTGAGLEQVYARGQGSFVQGFASCMHASSRARIQSGNNANGSFVQGYVYATGGYNGTLSSGGNDIGAFAQGAVKAITATGLLRANQDGAFAQGYALNASIDATGNGSFARGFANGYNITATAAGAGALGYANAAAITASAANAFQFGEGVNAVADSLQINSEIQFFGPTGRMRFTGILECDPTTVTGTTHTAADEHVILVDDDTAGSAVTVTLPLAADADAMYYVKKLGTTANVIVDGNGAETVDGAANATLTLQHEAILVVSNGSAWFVL